MMATMTAQVVRSAEAAAAGAWGNGRWARRAAAGGCPSDPASLYDLGLSYATGTGGKPIDPVEAHKWFNLAGFAGSGEAPAARAELAACMCAHDIAAAQRAARDWVAGIEVHRFPRVV